MQGAAALVVVATDAGGVEPAATALRAHGALGVECRALGAGRVVVHGGFPHDDASTARVVAALRHDGWSAVGRPVGGGHLAAWQAHTAVRRIAGRVWICFPWSELDRDDVPQGVEVVEIDPGVGFGTGDHPSTRLLVAELAARLAGGERVADVGCGSGVLAIVAARLGACSVDAVDLAEGAREATARNAAANGVTERVSVRGAGVEQLDGRYDVVLANIGAEPLIALAAPLARHLRPGGWLALSGLSPAQSSRVEAAYRPLGVEARPLDGEWQALILRAS